ncbi:MAG: ABC transporter substrate-binding protein [Pseudomonadota bacterium]
MNRALAVVVVVWCLSSAQAAAQSCPDDLDARRVAVAGGSITEIIYALGMQSQLVAVDRTSNYPEAATRLPSIGYVRAVSAEGLLSLDPTLVLGEHDTGPLEVVAQVRNAGVPVVVIPEVHTVDGIFAKVDCVATIMGAPSAAVTALKASMQDQVQQIQSVIADTKPRVAVLLSLADGVPTGGGTATSADGVLAMAGAENVLAGFEGWKPISLEAMAASDPQYIVMPDRGLVAAGGRNAVRAHPSIALTQAGQADRIIGIDGMSLLGFGPRTLGAAVELARAFKAGPAGQ